MPALPEAIGNYEIERLLGTGRHGRTYLGRLPTGEAAALREIACRDLAAAQRLTADPDLKRLATVIAGISHVGIANRLEVFALGKRVYVAEEFLETPSLLAVLDEGGPLPAEEVWAIGCQILTALQFGHLRGLLHLDLRAENVHYDRPQRHAVLTDFGHMQLLLEMRPRLALADVAEELQAPEIARGALPTPATEVYSVGVMLYQVLTGQLPPPPQVDSSDRGGGRFDFLEVGGVGAGGVARKEPLETIVEHWPGVVAVVRGALAVSPEDRYQRASRMHNALAQAYRDDVQGVEFREPGEWVVEEDEEQTGGSAPTGAVRVEGGVQFCEQCGKPIPPGAKVCLSCGSPRPRKAAVSLPPQRREPQSYFQRHADKLLSEGKYEQAEKAYRMAAQRHPKDPVAQRDLGDILAINRRFSNAETAYRQVLRSDPGDLEARHELGRVLLSQGKGREAAQQFRRVLAGDPTDELRLSALTQLGAAHAEMGDHEAARTAWEEVLQEDPRNARVHYCIATSFLAQGHEGQARGHLDDAIKADPDYGEARHALRNLDQRARRDVGWRAADDGWVAPPFAGISLTAMMLDDALRGVGSLLGRDRWGGRAARRIPVEELDDEKEDEDEDEEER